MQIENEYNHIQLAYEAAGDSYVQWAAKMAVSLYNGVPWIMCKQKDAPDPVVSSMYNQFGIVFFIPRDKAYTFFILQINACNGRHCGDTFTGPNKPYKPSIWTENWTAQ